MTQVTSRPTTKKASSDVHKAFQAETDAKTEVLTYETKASVKGTLCPRACMGS